jgi:hypothetical protein
LKIRKKEIIDHVANLNTRLEEINSSLGVKDDVLFVPELDKASEYPENYFEINDKDIEEYKARKEAAKLAKGSSKKKKKDKEAEVEDASEEPPKKKKKKDKTQE